MRFDSPCSEMVYDAGAYRARDMANVGWYEYFYGLQRDIPEFTCGTTLYQAAKAACYGDYRSAGCSDMSDYQCDSCKTCSQD